VGAGVEGDGGRGDAHEKSYGEIWRKSMKHVAYKGADDSYDHLPT
jgi:hypothetical protein